MLSYYIIIISVGDLVGRRVRFTVGSTSRPDARVGVNEKHTACFSVAFGLIFSK